MSSSGPTRREFLERLTAGAALGAAVDVSATAQSRIPADAFIGIQMGPHTILDEGIERTLDLIQETAAVNAVLTYSHAFHADLRKPIQFLAPDHGVPPRANRSPLPSVWVRHDARYFENTSLRVKPTDPSLEYATRDLFNEMQRPARARGMKVYARVLESRGAAIEGFSRVATVDTAGRPLPVACWSNPEYRNFWAAIAEDLFRSYDLDGLQWGAERTGPLMNVILPWNDRRPGCFCEHCRARGRAAGIDAERARRGYDELYSYVRARIANEPKPADGVFVGFLRLLLRYPEILAWEYQYRLGREEVMQAIYKAAKSAKPSAKSGGTLTISHRAGTWSIAPS